VAEHRRSARFSWNCVDETLIRKLLRTAYISFGPPEQAKRVSSLTPDQLRRTAERVLGRPPKVGLRFELTDTLRQGWLPTASAEDLANLTGLVNRYNSLTNRQERLDFLLHRNRTDSFVTNLWSAFIAAHKEEVLHSVAPTGAPKRIGAPASELIGEGLAARHSPYDHQTRAWRELDKLRSAGGRRSGLIVIPTGGGKTATMVTWLITELGRRAKLRVLWIADQQELVDQAAREFRDHARTAPVGFRRRLRAVHGQAGNASALADPDLDVVCTTRQSLIGKRFDGKAKATLRAFLTRPTVVVIDEAHHAVSPTYQELIEFLWEAGRGLMLVGLTATPWPAGAGQTAKLRQTFTRELASVATSELVAKGDLARPIIHTVTTSEQVKVNATDVKQLASGREVPPRVARQLDRVARNNLVVRQWVDRQHTWGKTLAFACDTAHADSLVDAFRGAGVITHVVHSAAGTDRATVLDLFRQARDRRSSSALGCSSKASMSRQPVLRSCAVLRRATLRCDRWSAACCAACEQAVIPRHTSWSLWIVGAPRAGISAR
jgi:superfamily II DNA or RNA helicase